MKPWQDLTNMATDIEAIYEFKKKFQGTIFGIIPKGRTNPFFVRYKNYAEMEEQQLFETADNNRVVLKFDTENTVFIPDPVVGMYNTKHGVAHFYRLPFRQHKRGLYCETAHISLLRNKIVNGPEFNNFDDLIFDVLNEELQRECGLHPACIYANNAESHAMNRDIVVTKSHLEKEGFSIFYQTSYIGQVNLDKRSIKIDVPLFKQELIDNLRNDKHVWRIE